MRMTRRYCMAHMNRFAGQQCWLVRPVHHRQHEQPGRWRQREAVRSP
jgi:hypothetical protein